MTLVARTAAQSVYVNLLRSKHAPLVIATGCPGTGKTHHAVLEGVAAVRSGAFERLVLARPAVHAGEDLGFLPGSAADKLDPFMRPMFDAMSTMLTKREIRAMVDDGRIELAPLAYMRGRTFSKSWVVLDEGQNTTPAQLKMALTRLGKDSKMVVTGDLDQVDIEGVSGLADLLSRLCPLRRGSYISYVQLTDKDVQRSEVVTELIQLYSA
jgi:phosphate starvation-inducible PhoH-like protein